MKTKLLGAALASALALSPLGMLAHAQTPVPAASSALHFTKLELSQSGGNIATNINQFDLTLKDDGTIAYTRANGPVVSDTATPAEMSNVRAAWTAALVTGGPHLAGHIIPDVPITTLNYSFLDMGGPTGGHMIIVNGSWSGVNHFPAKVQAVISALRQIKNRLDGAKGMEIRGLVSTSSGQTYIEENKSKVFEIANADLAAIVRKAHAYVRAGVSQVVSTGAFGGKLDLAWVEGTANQDVLLYPVPPTVASPPPMATGTVKKGARVQVEDVVMTFWYRVRTANGKTGVVSAASIRIGQATMPAPTPGTTSP
jgi:hypothetical protein